MNEDLGWSPVTVEIAGQPPRIRAIAVYDPDDLDSRPFGVLKHAGGDGEARHLNVKEILNRDSEEFRFLTSSGKVAVVRATRPDDAATGGQFVDLPFDLPVEVIGAIVNGAIEQNASTLSAALDDQGDVHTILLESPLGIYARYSKTWIKLTDVGVISHLNVVDIPAEDLNTYDEADIAGNMVNINDLNPKEPEVIEVIQAPPVTVTATAGPTRAVLIGSVEDLPGAIDYAGTDEGKGSRWYVARRAKALGWTEPLPWE